MSMKWIILILLGVIDLLLYIVLREYLTLRAYKRHLKNLHWQLKTLKEFDKEKRDTMVKLLKQIKELKERAKEEDPNGTNND